MNRLKKVLVAVSPVRPSPTAAAPEVVQDVEEYRATVFVDSSPELR
jgi:hypothetical protein